MKTLDEIYEEQKAKGILPPYKILAVSNNINKFILHERITSTRGGIYYIIKSDFGVVDAYEANCNLFSLPQKPKVKLYAYVSKYPEGWFQADGFYKDDESFTRDFKVAPKFKKLENVFIEVEEE